MARAKIEHGRKIKTTPPSPFKKNKLGPIINACWAFPLVI
jgi:hypothetical protein